ncbi:MAG: serine/threonine-protein kinase [Bdellovibrionota bacterium]
MNQNPPSYSIISKIGEGGMAEIYRAIKQGPNAFQKQVAIKKILPRFSKDPSFIHMLSQEAQIHAQLHHPNIVQLYDFFEFDQNFFMVMEYVEGSNLKQLLHQVREKNISLPWQMSLSIVLDVLMALDYAHHANDTHVILHRDISPHNVLVSTHGEIKLTDFGIAKTIQNEEQSHSGMVKGKFRYLSPEQVRAQKLSPQSDLFSTAVMLFEMLTSIHPFDASNEFQTMKNICDQPLPSFSDLGRKDLHHLEASLQKALSKDPHDRFESAQAFYRDLVPYQDPSWSMQTSKKEIQTILKTLNIELHQNQQETQLTPVLLDGTHSVFEQSSISEVQTQQADTFLEKSQNIHSMKWIIFAGLLCASVGSYRWMIRKNTPPVFSNLPAQIEPSAPLSKDPDGFLTISEPVGGKAYINGKELGILPIHHLKIKEGKYLILIDHSTGKSMYQITIARGQHQRLSWKKQP